MNFRHLVGASAIVAIGATGLPAQTIIRDNTTPLDVFSVINYQTDFNMIGGMEVSWTRTAGGGSDVWHDLGSGNWGVWTDNFKLWQSGTSDTYFTKWNLWAINLSSFSLEALPGVNGNAVFDTKNHSEYTLGSSLGLQFEFDPSLKNDLGYRVTYQNPVGVGGADPLGDLYGKLTVEFGDYVEQCADGWAPSGDHSCKQWTGEYTCAAYSGYHLDGTKCKKSGHSDKNADKVYAHQDKETVWQDAAFGTSDKCIGGEDPDYEAERETYYKKDDSGHYILHNGHKIEDYTTPERDNGKCSAKFWQDMDNVNLEDPNGHPTGDGVVPEPMTMTLLATGLAGLAATRRRRSK